ncbi:MAG TPA: hypothetical protein VMW48_01695 [Vicinamibacterales bacterium]|nr:hypothetical protein [Vicinamibacterales bacterium]
MTSLRCPGARLLASAVIVLATLPSGAAAQAPQPERPRSQVPTLGRPTRPDDPAPVLDFWAYFKGAWNVTWDYPESPLGPADVLFGQTVYSEQGPGRFAARTEAENSGGAFTITETFVYARDAHTITRAVTDSRGFSYTQSGTVAGDLGGQFTIRLEGAPFTHQGHTVRVNSVMRLLAPLNYRTQTTIAVDGGPFTNYGNPWWRKDATAR